MRRHGFRAAEQLRSALQRTMSTRSKKGSDRIPHTLSKAALQKAHAPGHELPTAADAAAATKPAVTKDAAKALQQPAASKGDAGGIVKAAVGSSPSTGTGAGSSLSSGGSGADEGALPPRGAPSLGTAAESPTAKAPSATEPAAAAAVAPPSPAAGAPTSAAAGDSPGIAHGAGVGPRATEDAAKPIPTLSSAAVSGARPLAPGVPAPGVEVPLRATQALGSAGATAGSSSGAGGGAGAEKGAPGAAGTQRPSAQAGIPAVPSGTPTVGKSQGLSPPVAGAPGPNPSTGQDAVPPPRGSSTPAPGPGDGKRWLLHPALPVDVRLVGGLAAASAASYWYFNQRQADEEAARQLAARSERDLDALDGAGENSDNLAEVVQSLQPSGSSADTLEQRQHEAPEAAREEESPHSTEAELWSKLHPDAGTAAGGDSSRAEAGAGTDSKATAEEEPEIGDSTPIIDFFREALIAVPQAPEEEEEQADGAAAARDAPSEATTEGSPADEDSASEATSFVAAGGEEASEEALAEEAQPALDASAGSAGAADESDGQDGEGALADAAAIAAAESRGGAGEGVPRGTLGIEQELGAPALVRRAIERGEGAGDNWEEYRHRLAQAASDARTFAEALRSAEEFHFAEVARLEAELAARDRRGDAILEAAQREALEYQRRLLVQAATAERKRAADLQLQASELAAKALEAAVRERCERVKEVDNVRLRLGALGRAFSKRSEQTRVSHEVHQIALATFGLTDALDMGKPFAVELDQLAAGGRDDPLVQAALHSLPADLARQGLPTEGQLRDRFQDVARAARSLALLPEGRLGPLSVGLSKLAAHLKMDERSAVKAGVTVEEAGISPNADLALAQAEAHLAVGDLVTAANALQSGMEGTAAAPVVSDWVHSALARAAANQAVRLLHAHSTALCASLS